MLAEEPNVNCLWVPGGLLYLQCEAYNVEQAAQICFSTVSASASTTASLYQIVWILVWIVADLLLLNFSMEYL